MPFPISLPLQYFDISLCVWVYMYTCLDPYVYHSIAWSWSYRQLWAPYMCRKPKLSSSRITSTLHHSIIYSTMSPQRSKTSSSPCISLTLRWGTYSCLHPTSGTYCGDVWPCPSLPGPILRNQTFSQCNQCNLFTKLYSSSCSCMSLSFLPLPRGSSTSLHLILKEWT